MFLENDFLQIVLLSFTEAALSIFLFLLLHFHRQYLLQIFVLWAAWRLGFFICIVELLTTLI